MDVALLLANFGLMSLAFLLAVPTAWDREKRERSAGLRTYPLVAIASCGYTLIGSSVFAEAPEAQARIVEGLITGIGFIGGGAILKMSDRVHGTATAASIWSTGALGAAVGFQRFEIALLLSVINFAVLRWLNVFKEQARTEEPE
jgi:putative Mg2+ transporter-C (MgtC) family protein